MNDMQMNPSQKITLIFSRDFQLRVKLHANTSKLSKVSQDVTIM